MIFQVSKVLERTVVVMVTSFQNYIHPEDHTIRTFDTPGFKPFTVIKVCPESLGPMLEYCY